jgi:hypothetical protein
VWLGGVELVDIFLHDMTRNEAKALVRERERERERESLTCSRRALRGITSKSWELVRAVGRSKVTLGCC